jgi:single-stranded DNA-binding protein
MVTGRLRQRSWEAPEGEQRSVTELEADEVGASLKWATAKVERTSQRGNGERSSVRERQAERGDFNDAPAVLSNSSSSVLGSGPRALDFGSNSADEADGATSSLSGFCTPGRFHRISSATWASDIPLEIAANRSEPMGCGPNVDQAGAPRSAIRPRRIGGR